MRAKNEMPTPAAMLAYIQMYTSKHGWPPSRREAAAHFGIGLESTQRILGQCVADGLVKVGGGARQVTVTQRGERRIRQLKQIGGWETKL